MSEFAEKHQRYAELRRDPELSDEQFAEKEELGQWLNEAIIRSVPVPSCCKASQDYPAIALQPELETGRVRWLAATHDFITERLYHQASWYLSRPDAQVCPYCGKALPEVRLKDPPPAPLCTYEPDSGYCDTCGERLMCCLCYPPMAAYEEVPNG